MTKDEKAHKQAVAALGCSLCYHLHGPHEPGEVELHHLRAGGWGRGSYLTLMGLCFEHHRGNTGIHGMGTKAFERHYNITQKELLQWVLERVK